MKISLIMNEGEYKGLADLAFFRCVTEHGMNADKDMDLMDAFKWGKTKEGAEWWDKINECKYECYRELYPEGWLPKWELDKPETVATLRRIEDKLGHYGC